MTSPYDFEVDAAQPADIRAAVEVGRSLIRAHGCPSRDGRGAHRVLIVMVVPGGVDVMLRSFTQVLVDLPDPDLEPVLQRAFEQAATAASAVVLLALNPEGNYWCGAATTGPAKDMEA